MSAIRQRLTYANVVSTLALFLVLCGGVALAAKVPKKSVGPAQLKANAVSTAKIRANAVTTRKIKRNAVSNAKIKGEAVNTEKLADKAVNFEKLEPNGMPFGKVVHSSRGTASLAITEEAQVFPLAEATYIQAAHENDSFLGALDVTFSPSCEPPRTVAANLLLDSPQPLTFSEADVVASGDAEDKHSGSLATRIELGPYFTEGIASATRYEPGVQKSHKLSLVVTGTCTGTTSGITATFGGANVIGTE